MRGFAAMRGRDVGDLALERGHRRARPLVLDVDGIFPFDHDGDGGKGRFLGHAGPNIGSAAASGQPPIVPRRDGLSGFA